MRTRGVLHTLAAASALVVAACADSPTPTESSVSPGDAFAERQTQAAAVDQSDGVDLAALARAIPGFGGYYLDNGVPTVYLTDARERPATETALAGNLRANGFAPAQLRVRRGDFDYQQLSGRFDRLSMAALALPGVAFVDLDEASNRVLVGVEVGATGAAAAAGASVLGAAARLRIPSAAVVVRRVEPIRNALTLQDRTRPVRGGFQINFPGFLCTLGFNAMSGMTRSFITNSHCTSVQGGVEGTLYWQNLQSGGAANFLGTEVADPLYTTGGGCPVGRLCRRSDSSRGAYDAAATSRLGRIARTTGPNNGSLTIGATPNFMITAESPNDMFVIGTVVNKVGRTTGWSQGAVTNTRVNTNVGGTNFTQFCQTFVSAGVNSGDSGSPVFRIISGNNVRLLGILWGGSGTTLFVFSPLKNIEQELGPLTTF